MPSLYSTITATEPAYGERVVRVHGAVHAPDGSYTTGVDLVTGERLRMPIGSRWDHASARMRPESAQGWSWRPLALAEAERRAGLPTGSLPAYSDTARTDLWADERMRNPAFIALLTVLTDHPEVVFDSVDWRAWVHLPHPHQAKSADAPDRPSQRGLMGEGRHPLSAGRQRRHGALRLLPLPAALRRQQPRRDP